MKKLAICLIAIIASLYCAPAFAQSKLNNTGIAPMTFNSGRENVSLNLNDGSTFRGIKDTGYMNGQIVSVTYFGTLTLRNGTRYVTFENGNGFDQNFQFPMGVYYEIAPNGDLYQIRAQNGAVTSRSRFDREYNIVNNCINIPKTREELEFEYYMNSAPQGTHYDRRDSSSDNYNRHEATCKRCNGTGKCPYCGGDGWLDNGKKCTQCHDGTCTVCQGTKRKIGFY